MALFGAPRAHGDDALRAIRAALEIQASIPTVLMIDTGPLAVHVGIAMGEVVAGRSPASPPRRTLRRSSRPTGIEDVPSTRLDPFPSFDNFAWRAFIALNWPSLTDTAHRGEPDRAARAAKN